MKANSQTKKTITLVLEEDEAKWVKQLVQNPVMEDEDKFSNVMRNLIWIALSKQGVEL